MACDKLCSEARQFKEGNNPYYRPSYGDKRCDLCLAGLEKDHYLNRYYKTAKCDCNIIQDGQRERSD